jgi:hypothetical protein
VLFCKGRLIKFATGFWACLARSESLASCPFPSVIAMTKKETKITKIFNAHFDIVMAIDVFEHVEDYFGFLRKLRGKAEYKIFHIPLELSVQSVLRSSIIIEGRKSVGHIHYFTKETALETLKDTGHEIIDYFYTGNSLELPNRGWKANLMKVPIRLAFFVNKDLAVRILGGFSLMVLAK